MNDERPIEKLLRRAAQKRSAEAGLPPELHPANRRSLQAEVARQFPKPDAPKQSVLAEWWNLLKRRWVYGVAGFALLWVAAIAIIPLVAPPKSKPQTELALNFPHPEKLGMKVAEETPVLAEASFAVNSATPSPGEATTLPTPPSSVAAPSMAVTLTTRNDRDRSAKRETRDSALVMADAMVATEAAAQSRKDGSLTLAANDATSSGLSRAKTASTPQRSQTERRNTNAELRAGSSGGNFTAQPEDAALKAERQLLAAELGKERRADSGLGVMGSVISAQAAPPATQADGYYADKALLNRGGGVEQEQLTRNSQMFSNATADQQARPKALRAYGELPRPVSSNFKIEQMGRDLRVIDGDGSVYTGVVDEENTLYKQKIARQNWNLSNAYEGKFKFQTPKSTPAQSVAKQQAAEYFRYRVEGTNRSLNQNVVFSWNFIDTNALAAGNLDYKVAEQKLDATKLPSQFPALLQNSFINGRAQFGEGREVEVNALPVKP
jgi:hypothetical protein